MNAARRISVIRRGAVRSGGGFEEDSRTVSARRRRIWMKSWLAFVVLTVLCWGAYVPVLHQGQGAFLPKGQGALRAFLFVGLAYFLLAGVILLYLWGTRAEPLEFVSATTGWQGVKFSTIAGVLGAVGALGIVFALKNGGRPTSVVPLVFSGAPIVGTIVGMIWHRPVHAPNLWYYAGILLAAAGAGLVLANRPS
ncbi:MAG: hypothetical protein DPW13_14715 [Planctomycetes bacterium]|nr:hypothetical protein [Planctomycetota bacterium]